MNLHPSVDLDLGRGFGLGVAGISYWRQSKGDGIYDVPGQLVRRGDASDRRYIGTQGELLLSWQPTPTVSYAVSYSIFRPGGFVRDSGPARDIHMLGLEAMFRV
nr:alginate export family protein [Sphingomonas montanisoli]